MLRWAAGSATQHGAMASNIQLSDIGSGVAVQKEVVVFGDADDSPESSRTDAKGKVMSA